MNNKFISGKKILYSMVILFFISLFLFVSNETLLRIAFLHTITKTMTFLTMFAGVFTAIILFKTATGIEQKIIEQNIAHMKERLGETLYYSPFSSFDPNHVFLNPAAKWNNSNGMDAVNEFKGMYRNMPYQAYELRTFFANANERRGKSLFHGCYFVAEVTPKYHDDISIRTNDYFHKLYLDEQKPYSIKNKYNLNIKTYYPQYTGDAIFDSRYKSLFANPEDADCIRANKALLNALINFNHRYPRDFSIFISPRGYIALAVDELKFSRLNPVADSKSFEQHFFETLDEFVVFMDLFYNIYNSVGQPGQ